ncbi:polyhydroxybutyrate depolymerase [Halobacillus alkaliphilus]|uniref:Polyhydroxybutyrate depolymerase n=1 Tax=Halobacillus alkaliphilus TaxID=396056 RepID=A0A1I2L6F4_9BACI|nr:alpha/beta hydrolase-fold protein [Halobacillus alkaliphilus]SFF73037.1 polyhydroxybutyrate depolymerase [Halobacillus alkaliphilus]
MEVLGPVTMTFEERNRTFYYSLPEHMEPCLPVVFCFHGAGSSARHHMKVTAFHKLSEDHQVITVFPDAVHFDPSDRMTKQWNEGREKNTAFQRKVNDVGFVLELIEWFKQRYPVDESRIYATGFSNGSAFSLRLGLECQDVFAGVGGVSGPLVKDLAEKFQWSKPMPMLFIMGTGDKLVPYDGYYDSTYMIDQLLSAEKTVEFFVASWGDSGNNHYERVMEDEEFSIIKNSYPQEEEKVVFYSIEGGGHTWPGGPLSQASSLTGKVAGQLDATKILFDHLTKIQR